MPQKNTSAEHALVTRECKTLFLQKHADYGDAWRILRPISLLDQIYIKAFRVRTLQEKKVQKIADSIRAEFIAIVNYAVIGVLIDELLAQGKDPMASAFDARMLGEKYDEVIRESTDLCTKKNHDYGEAWRVMSMEAMVDLILMKIYRVRSILQQGGHSEQTEGVRANYLDMLNYAVFALIKLSKT